LKHRYQVLLPLTRPITLPKPEETVLDGKQSLNEKPETNIKW